MKDYGTLVREAIEAAKKEYNAAKKATTVVYDHEDGTQTITEFYKKGKAIWCRMTTGCIVQESRVYKVKSEKPYIRNFGSYWYLDDEDKAAISALA